MPQIRYKFREEYEDVNESEMREVAENAGVDMVNTVPGRDAQMMGAVLPKMGFPCRYCGGRGWRKAWMGHRL
jgi:hypothetical protein